MRGQTARQSMIGEWREHFEEAHVDEFKARAGDLLIELGYEASSDWPSRPHELPDASLVGWRGLPSAVAQP